MELDEGEDSWTEARLRFFSLPGRITGWKPLPTLQQRLLNPANLAILTCTGTSSVKGVCVLVDQWHEFDEFEQSGVLASAAWQLAHTWLFVFFSLALATFSTLPEAVRTLLSTPPSAVGTCWTSPKPNDCVPKGTQLQRRASISLQIPFEMRKHA